MTRGPCVSFPTGEQGLGVSSGGKLGCGRRLERSLAEPASPQDCGSGPSGWTFLGSELGARPWLRGSGRGHCGPEKDRRPSWSWGEAPSSSCWAFPQSHLLLFLFGVCWFQRVWGVVGCTELGAPTSPPEASVEVPAPASPVLCPGPPHLLILSGHMGAGPAGGERAAGPSLL